MVHFAAESHVDRSIFAPQPVFETNLRGTFNLLETMRAQRVARFIHVSTDEVYGSLEHPLEADEQFPLQPSSPYSAGKAGSDLLALSYHKTYKLPVIVTRASNNYGPFQFPEKLIPLMITHAFETSLCRSMATECRFATGFMWKIIAAPFSPCWRRAAMARSTISAAIDPFRIRLWWSRFLRSLESLPA